MPDPAQFYDVAQVELKLSKAWAFLSGKERSFRHLPHGAGALEFAEFSFFMPLHLAKGDWHGGVGVLIQHGDAICVAANMFGVEPQDIQHADLRDACAEVCNVFSDCLATHFGAGQEVKMSLPRAASPSEYERIAENSVIRAIYQAYTGDLSLRVVLYDSLGSPS